MKSPTGPRTGPDRVIRGGAWADGADYCRSAHCYWNAPGLPSSYLGFRLVRRVKK